MAAEGADTPDVGRIVRAKLYAWGDWQREKALHSPHVDVASRYRRLKRMQVVGIDPPGFTSHQSPQERWAERHQNEIKDSEHIEKTMRRLSQFDRNLVWLRYVERNRWPYIIRESGRDRATVFRAHSRIIRVFAASFGL